MTLTQTPHPVLQARHRVRGPAVRRDPAGVPPGGLPEHVPPPSRTHGVGVAATALSLLGALLVAFVADVAVVGRLRYARDQRAGYARLRADLANATAPVGPVAPGTPLAVLTIAGERTVVREGTTSGILASGPGHRRDTVLPGQPGPSVLMGRAAAYGGPFSRVPSLRPGDVVTVVTGQGEHAYRVLGVRRGGDPQPSSLAAGAGRLTLVTADGPAYRPTGVVRVDAELTTPAQPAPPRAASALAGAERPMRGDRAALVPLLLGAQALLAAALALTWLRARWGRRQAWLTGVPVVAALSVAVADSAARLLPNLM